MKETTERDKPIVNKIYSQTISLMINEIAVPTYENERELRG